MDDALDVLLRWEKWGRWLRTLVIACLLVYGGYVWGYNVMLTKASEYIASLAQKDAKEPSSYNLHPETWDQPGHYPYLEM